jgi:aminoglycoside phosphotransferase (APT) family kinase protein
VIENAQLLAEGREALVYLLPDGKVLKLLREGTDPSIAAREAAVCRLLVAMGQSAPTVHDVVTVDGRQGLVMDRIEGTDLLAALERNPARVLTAARVLAEVHASMHECQGPTELPDLVDALGERVRAAPPLPAPLKDLALEVLHGLPRGDRLTHSDFHLQNILGTWRAPVVIDWAYAARGNPMSDVARTELVHRVGALPPETPPLFRAIVRVGRRLLVRRYLAVYRRHRPLDDATLPRWTFVHIAARLNEPIPEEHPMLLAMLERSAPAMRS